MSEIDPRAEERAFYDDTALDELDLTPATDVHVVRRPGPRSTFAVRLDADTIEQLRQVALQHGTRPTQLARDWIIERLEQEQQRVVATQQVLIGPPSHEIEIDAFVRDITGRRALALLGRSWK